MTVKGKKYGQESGRTILDKIVQKKREEIELAKRRTTIEQLQLLEFFNRECFVLRDFILDPKRTGIIAEFKRRSPSKGTINDHSSVQEVTNAYDEAGASALSILTDFNFFGGKDQDLLDARAVNKLPLLRKDFILDEYQITEAKALGADIILLIAAILTPKEVHRLAKYAKNLGMNVLLEVHNKEELDRSLADDLDAVGVNNRNLADFSVSVRHSHDLVDHIPSRFLKISESGISHPETIMELRAAGFDGFLIGENFMKEANPGLSMKAFVSRIHHS
ncbi:MAG: indole-3-glycerol phosphate synthase TrpC [Bacteroidetes bacterium]|nr:indole-3-glycerol phosphate synthase TrpC [Bacteroidota bacterium]